MEETKENQIAEIEQEEETKTSSPETEKEQDFTSSDLQKAIEQTEVEEKKEESAAREKIHFTIEEMKNLSQQSQCMPQPDGRTFQIVPVETTTAETPRTPRIVNDENENSENRENVSFRRRTPAPGANLYMPLTRSRSPDPERFYRETPDLFEGDINTLPSGPLRGAVKLLNKNNGRIRLPYTINNLRDVFFHFKDLEIDPDDQLEVGDTVEYQLSTYQNKLCGIHVKRSLVSSLSVPSIATDAKKTTKKYLQPEESSDLKENWRM